MNLADSTIAVTFYVLPSHSLITKDRSVSFLSDCQYRTLIMFSGWPAVYMHIVITLWTNIFPCRDVAAWTHCRLLVGL